MTEKEIERIIKRAPKITKAIKEEVNEDFKNYIFYEKTIDGEREFTCSHCNKKYTLGKKENSLLLKKHNDVVKCPKCGASAVLKNIKTSQSCKALREAGKYVYFIPGKDPEQEAWIIAFCASKDYKLKKKDNLVFSIDSIYLITPQGSSRFIQYYYCYFGKSGWRIDNSLLEPFLTSYISGYECYMPRHFEKLQETFLRYSGLNIWLKNGRQTYCRYLAMYPTHRAYEMLLKMGLEEFVIDSVAFRKENKRIINWNAQNPKEVFRKPKSEILKAKVLVESHYGSIPKLLNLYASFKRSFPKATLEEANEIYKIAHHYDRNDLIDCLKKANVSPRRFLNYIDKTYERVVDSIHCAQYAPTITRMYLDYLEMAEKLNYDLTQEVVLLPKDMAAAHDTATETLNAIYEESRRKYEEERLKRMIEEAERMQCQNQKLLKKRLKQYSYENDTFAILVPEELTEIVSEGQALQHCVGGYTSRHAKGQCTILFLRNKAEIDKSLYTIEMHDKDMIQVQGYKNITPLIPDAKAFFDEWLEWVKGGSPRKKDGTPKRVKETTAA